MPDYRFRRRRKNQQRFHYRKFQAMGE